MEESMKDYKDMLEESYSLMGDGVHDQQDVPEFLRGGQRNNFKEIRAFDEVSGLQIVKKFFFQPAFWVYKHISSNTESLSCLWKMVILRIF